MSNNKETHGKGVILSLIKTKISVSGSADRTTTCPQHPYLRTGQSKFIQNNLLIHAKISCSETFDVIVSGFDFYLITQHYFD